MAATDDLREPDDWEIVCAFLPEGWRDAAFRCGAWTRARGIKDADTLLRVLMVHLADGCSLQETAVRVGAVGWTTLSSVAIFKRLRAAEEWLRWMAERLWRSPARLTVQMDYRIRAVDATTVQEPGSTGTDWRVHYALDLANLQCDYFSLTDASGGETFRRLPVQQGDLILGDRAYGTPPGVAHVLTRGGHVLVRINLNMLPLYDKSGTRVDILRRLRSLRIGEVGEWPTCVHAGRDVLAGRLIGVKRSRRSAQLARKRLQREASRKGHTPAPDTVAAADYVFIWTSMPAKDLPTSQALQCYRLRWQIELAFKRMKSLMGLGALPKTTDASARAWIHGKLLIALLIECFIEAADSLSPWGYRLPLPPQSVARNAVRLS